MAKRPETVLREEDLELPGSAKSSWQGNVLVIVGERT